MHKIDFDEMLSLLTARLSHAAEKHPEFAKRILWRDTDLATGHLAKALKDAAEKNGSAEDALLSECHEFLLEANRGNFARAYDEALDVIAVVIRTLVHMDCLEKSAEYVAEEK